MRRRTPGAQKTEEFLTGRRARCVEEDPARVIQALEPFVADRRKKRLLEVIDRRLASVSVIFEAPHDPHNGAAVVRTCEAFGVHRLHVIESKESFLAAASVARGAQKWVNVVRHDDAESAIVAAQAHDLTLVAAHPMGEMQPRDLRDIPRLAVVVGNERDGISPRLAAACAHTVRVPMRGFVESLNVSVTCAILLHEAVSGRPGDLSEEDRQRLYARGLYLSSTHADDLLAGLF